MRREDWLVQATCVLFQLLATVLLCSTTNGQTIQDDLYIVPIAKINVPEYGSVSFYPQVYYFNSSYSSSSLQVSYSMADGSALKSGMTVLNGVLNFYSNPAHVGQLSVLRNVSYYNSENKFITISHVTIFQVIPTPTPNQLSLLFSDDFLGGDLSKWYLLDGTMKLQSAQLNIYQNNTKLVTVNSFDLTNQLGVTFTFNLLTTWTASRGILIYVDKLNYYEINLSGSSFTITRCVNGNPTVILQSTKLLQVHAANYYSSYKVYLQYTKEGMIITIAKIGILASDYVLNVVDSFTNIDVFKSVKLGFYEKTVDSPSQSNFKVLQCKVYNGKLMHSRQGVTYHVDGKNGNDLNDGLSSSSAFKTLNTAQYQLLPDDTLLIHDSIYRESFQINRQASVDHPITIKAFNQPTTTSTFTTTPYTHTAILDGSLVLDNSKFKKITNSNIYQIALKFTPDVVYQDNVKMSLAMKPLPSNLQDEYFVDNYIHPKNNSIQSSSDNSMIYLQLDDMFKYDQFGSQAPDDFWVGAIFYQFYKAGVYVITRKIVSYNATTNTIGLLYNDLPVVTSDSYAIANHIGCFSQAGQYVVNTNFISVSLSTDPTVSQTILEVSALDNGAKIVNGMEGINLQGLMVRKYLSDGIVCSGGCTNLVISNCSAKYNGGSGISLSYSSNLLVDGGEMSQNFNNGVNFGGAVKDSTVQNTYTHRNINNGIWVGNAGTPLFYCVNILLKSNKVGPQNSERLHPDNIQLASADNITLESNILTQDGDQNMWMDKNGLVIFKRNIIIGGPLGVNNAQSVVMFNNVFYNSYLRFAVAPVGPFVGLDNIADWSDMFNSITDTNSQSIANILVWSSMNSQLSSTIKSYSSYKSLTTADKTAIIDQINSVINNTSFMAQFKDVVIPFLGKEHVVAYPYWNAMTKRGLMDKSTGKLTNSNNETIYEAKGLTRAILDEVFDGIIYKGPITFYPRIVSIKNNAFIESFLQLPSTTYSLLPYWESNFNYIEQPASYHANIWKALAGPNTVFETSAKNTTLYFKNMTAYDFHLNCNSNITLIDKGTNVGLPYYGQAPDIGPYESNCNNEINPVNPVTPKPSISTNPQISAIASPKPNQSRVVSSTTMPEWKVFYLLIGLIISMLVP
ncbi:predicted protein [Naegleria gruberi]|uniref:Predicted protein n=1 Tax=Naegleria gruberi TaxID=5762 RepID=D2W035_NAEGR|nr:uncharacterized protein NAEGRDRAFT_74717 [Naegleria gruberi]EFC37504.1 predicted protein [Naegleria gruberi]|eukprot:XP_002670248.1 predicted protein [Naegleria gruberi strain NEG-M]